MLGLFVGKIVCYILWRIISEVEGEIVYWKGINIVECSYWLINWMKKKICIGYISIIGMFRVKGYFCVGCGYIKYF